MQLKAEWLNSRKQQIMKELAQCDLQNQEIMQQIMKDNSDKSKQINSAHQVRIQLQNSYKQQVGKYLIQIKTLENLIATKESVMQSLQSQNSQLLASNEQRSISMQQNYSRILELDHLLTVEKEENQRIKAHFQKIISQKQSQYLQERGKTKRQYEQEMQAKQKKLIQSHEQQLSQIKRNNIQLLQKIQSEYQNIHSKSSESNKQIELDCTRLVTENTRLLSTVNEYKLKILTFESTSTSQQQQVKLLQKQIQVIKENNKRQNTFLRQEKASLSDKNKKLIEKVQQLSWSNRQNSIKKDEDIKKIKKEVDKSFQEILTKAQEENKKNEEMIDSLQKDLQTKDKELHQMQEISLRIKSLYQTQEQQMSKLREQKQQLRKEVIKHSESNPIKINQELKNEIIRKNCEMEVLQDEIKRLKSKINTAAAAQQQYAKHKQIMEQQNKMLLSEIIFLKEKEKKGKNKMQDSKLSKSNFLSQMNSEQSKDYEDVEEYKKIIQFMTEEMNEVSKKIMEKDTRIDKLQQLVRRYQREYKIKNE